jgi:hypothetical protein
MVSSDNDIPPLKQPNYGPCKIKRRLKCFHQEAPVRLPAPTLLGKIFFPTLMFEAAAYKSKTSLIFK